MSILKTSKVLIENLTRMGLPGRLMDYYYYFIFCFFKTPKIILLLLWRMSKIFIGIYCLD